jgi:pyrroloquinoline quinone biosynthesis protein E
MSEEMKQNVYFADLTHCGTVANADTFPLGVGCIAAYAKKVFGEELHAEIFKFPDELNDALMANKPDVVCFSNYSWNAEISYAYAQFAKEKYPGTPIIMGGPNIGITTDVRRKFLADHPAIDFYIKFEGEYAFANLLKLLTEQNFDVATLRSKHQILDNVLYLDGDEYFEGSEFRVLDYMDIPSPYQMGLLDKFFDQGLRPLVEFTRGCPYACTFCTDSHSHRNKVFRKTADFVRAELEYIASHINHASDLIFADLNFGMYIEDIEFSKITRSVIDKYDWPKTITTSPGKSHPERVMESVKIINGEKQGVIKFAASLQSTDEQVLSAISRRNLPLDKIKPIMDVANSGEDSMEYFSELILALPNDSKEKHYNSLKDAIDKLEMNVVNVHQLTILDGSPLASPQQKDLYQLTSQFRVFVGCIGMYNFGSTQKPVAEVEEVIISNKTMSFEEWLECRLMSLLVKIYIDRDYFVEIFGLIRKLKLSPIDLLEHLRLNFVSQYSGFQELFDLFLAKTVEPLHESREKLEKLTSDPEVVAKFESGEFGGNELLVHRALAYLEYNDEIHLALRDATVSYLAENGHLNEVMKDYVYEASKFSQQRKFNPKNYTTEIEHEYNFNFIEAKAKAFKVLPSEMRMERKMVRFYFNDLAKEEIEYALRTWIVREGTHRAGDTASELAQIQFEENAHTKYSFGKLFHYSNLRVMNRTAKYIEITEPKTTVFDLPAPDPTPNRRAYEHERRLALAMSPRRLWNYIKYLQSTRRESTVSYMPIKLDIENVSRCNFRCTMCQVSEWDKGQRAADMSYDSFQKLIDEQIGVVEIKLQGMGEPLLQGEDYFKMIRYARSKHIWVRTVTNASLLHLNDNYKSLIDSGINEVQISIDAADAENYQKIRVGSNFEKAKSNCRLINDYCNDLDIVRTKMWTVVQKDNIDQLEDIVELASEIGFKYLVFSIGLGYWGQEKWKRRNSKSAVNGAFNSNLANTLMALGKSLGVTVQFWNLPDRYTTGSKTGLCPWPFERSYASSDGRVSPCCLISNPDTYEINGGDTLGEIWNGEEYSDFRQLHLDGDIPKICENCYER